ncbi:2812_t:CDS:2 [Ambispora gerdemannii]|uniref:2812_t:CDS:1 n=1 Tax=Ambispora gerdemannii TaxID=144530 RepID=A0A9N9CV89_9GLOM|nr:2812_t:CDS:2 [Ambispora gerdemannii]
MTNSSVVIRLSCVLLFMGIFVTAVILSIKLLRQGNWFSYSLVAFGDSLTDIGNTWDLTNGSIPSTAFYYRGRWSNGPTWIEVMSSKLGTILENYAYGGATSDNDIIPSNLTIPDDRGRKKHVPSLKDQVKEFLPNVSTTLHRFQTTFMIWIGGNDYQYLIKNYNTSTITPQILINSIQQSVNLLEEAGAHKILILNIPPLDRTPRYINSTGSDLEYIKLSIRDHNQRLTEMTRNFTRHSSTLVVKVFDVHNLTMEIIEDPRSFGFTNVDDPCVVIDGGGKREVSRCVNADEYLFWDDFHPTAKAHRLLANQLVKFLRSVDAIAIAAELSCGSDKDFLGKMYLSNKVAAVPVDNSYFETADYTEFDLASANFTCNQNNICGEITFSGIYVDYSNDDFDNFEGTTTKVTVVIVSGLNDPKKEYPYKIHEYPVPSNGKCDSVGNVLGSPLKTNNTDTNTATKCSPDTPKNCAEGDLSGKWGGLHGINSNEKSTFFYYDPYLDWDGIKSILGKSLVIYNSDNSARLACANITESYVSEYDDFSYDEYFEISDYV